MFRNISLTHSYPLKGFDKFIGKPYQVPSIGAPVCKSQILFSLPPAVKGTGICQSNECYAGVWQQNHQGPVGYQELTCVTFLDNIIIDISL